MRCKVFERAAWRNPSDFLEPPGTTTQNTTASTSARHAAWGRAAANAGATQKEAKDFSPMYFPSSLNPLEQQTQLQHSYNDWERIFDATTYVST